MQRSRIRKNQRVKKAQGRVQSVKDHAQWKKLHSKLGDRLLLALFFAPWSAKCKTMRSFLNDLSTRAECAHVVFAELDIDNSSLNGLAEEEDVAALPTIQLWKEGQCIHVAKAGDPMEVWQLVKKHAGEKPQQNQTTGRRWHFLGKCVAAGVTLVAAGLLGRQLLRRWADEEGQIIRSLDRISLRVKDLHKQSKSTGRRRRSRRRMQSADAGATAELRRLYEEQQELSTRLERLRQSRDGELRGAASLDSRSEVEEADLYTDSDED